MSLAPECCYDLRDDDVDCDQPSTHVVRTEVEGRPYQGRILYLCDEHRDAAILDDELVVEHHTIPTPIDAGIIGSNIVEGARLTVGSIAADRLTAGVLTDEQLHAARVPDGYECTRIPNHEGPCALRQVAAADPFGILTVPVPSKYRPSKWSTPWILLLGLIGYELWAVATSKAGGPLSHLVWWTYGERWSLRWWLCSSALNGLGLWAAAHFMFEWPEVKELLITVACAVGVGLIGWFVTR